MGQLSYPLVCKRLCKGLLQYAQSGASAAARKQAADELTS